MPPGNKIERTRQPNLLLIAGNGRNVGKTFLACKIIEQISKKNDVIGIKISSHFHPAEMDNVIIETNEFIIVEEIEISGKDSSLMLQAGAGKVYFVMAVQENLQKAFLWLNNVLPERAIVCESGGLGEFVDPGVFLFVKKPDEEIVKKWHKQFAPVMFENNGENFDFNIQRISFSNNRFSIE